MHPRSTPRASQSKSAWSVPPRGDDGGCPDLYHVLRAGNHGHAPVTPQRRRARTDDRTGRYWILNMSAWPDRTADPSLHFSAVCRQRQLTGWLDVVGGLAVLLYATSRRRSQRSTQPNTLPPPAETEIHRYVSPAGKSRR